MAEYHSIRELLEICECGNQKIWEVVMEQEAAESGLTEEQVFQKMEPSTKTSPPLFLFFCTHPMMVTFSPMFASESSAHRCVLFSPVIDSAILIYPPAFLFPYKSITESL